MTSIETPTLGSTPTRGRAALCPSLAAEGSKKNPPGGGRGDPRKIWRTPSFLKDTVELTSTPVSTPPGKTGETLRQGRTDRGLNIDGRKTLPLREGSLKV